MSISEEFVPTKEDLYKRIKELEKMIEMMIGCKDNRCEHCKIDAQNTLEGK